MGENTMSKDIASRSAHAKLLAGARLHSPWHSLQPGGSTKCRWATAPSRRVHLATPNPYHPPHLMTLEPKHPGSRDTCALERAISRRFSTQLPAGVPPAEIVKQLSLEDFGVTC